MKKIALATLVALSAASIVGCGGGGGGGPISAVSPEGAWQGTTSSDFDVNLLVLENNEIFAIFGNIVDDQFLVSGFNRGSGSVNGSNFSGTGTEYFLDGTVTRGSFNATVVEGVSLIGTVVGQLPVSFSATPIPQTIFDYGQSANINSIIGSWTGRILTGDLASINVLPSGTFTGSSDGCEFSGAVAPRASGKNVFNVNLTFSGDPCALPNISANGVGLVYGIQNTSNSQLIILVTNADNTAGTIFFAQR